MLWWVAGAAIPIAIHLWFRRPVATMPWAASQFLLAAVNRQARRLSIYQWILLMLRSLIMVVLAFALANPFLTHAPFQLNLANQRDSAHWIIVMDGSFSMDFRPEGNSRLEAAKEAAIEIVEQSQMGDGFSLIVMGSPSRVIIGDPAFDQEDIIRMIRAVEPSPDPANLTSTLQQVQTIAQQGRRKQKHLKQCKVHIYSDLATNTWKNIDETTMRRQFSGLRKLADINVYKFGSSSETNHFISSIEPLQWAVTPYREFSFQVTVDHFGLQSPATSRITIFINDEPVDVSEFKLQPQEPTNLVFNHRFSTTGDQVIRVVLESDQLPFDDERWLVVPVREQIQILCISNRPETARIVSIGIQPDSSDNSLFKTTVANPTALSESDLAQYDGICLCNVRSFTPDEATAIHRFAREGGGVIFFLGDAVDPTHYNEQFGGNAPGGSLLPGTLGSPVANGDYRFDPLEYEHPIVKPFQGFPETGLLTTPVWRYVKVVPNENSETRVALSFQNGDPAIVEGTFGRGRIIVYTGGVTGRSGLTGDATGPPWTAFASWPSFVPLVQEMVALSIRGITSSRNGVAGDVIGSELDPFRQSRVQVTAPDGIIEEAAVTTTGMQKSWSYGPLAMKGVYSVQLAESQQEPELYAANLDVDESRLSRMGWESLPVELRERDSIQAAQPSAGYLPRGQALYQYIVATLIFLLILELFAAWRFGKPVGSKRS